MADSTHKLLIVEDEPPLAELERLALESAGYEVLDVGRGDLGLEILEKEPISLVLLDYKLPDMNGLRFLSALGDRLARLPVIVVTGHANAKLAADLTEAGAAHFVIKDTELVFLQQLPKLVQSTAERFELKARIERQAEDLATQAEALEGAERRADEAKKAHRDLLGKMVDEVRAPVTAMLGRTETLLSDEAILQAPETRIQDLQAIQEHGEDLLKRLDTLGRGSSNTE